jgi:hypothetical protein
MTTENRHENDQLRAGLIARMPNLFSDTKGHLGQIYDLIRKYAQRKEYEVTAVGFNFVYSIVYRYLGVRDGTFFGASMIPSQDYSNDNFLNDVFEQLTAIQRLATHEKDLELSRQVMQCFAAIAKKCADIRYLATMPNEFTHSMLAVGYMAQNAEEALKVGLHDVGIQEADILKSIGLLMIGKRSTTAIGLISEHLSKIAFYGISGKASFLVSPVLRAYVLFLRGWIFQERAHSNISYRTLLDKTVEIIRLYHEFHVSRNAANMDMQFWIGEAVDPTYRTAIPFIFVESLQRISRPETTPKQREDAIAELLEFSEELWRFYDKLAKISAEKESFLIYYIDSNISHISLSLLGLFESDLVNTFEKDKIRDKMAWLLSVYWRLFDYHTQITSSFHHHILDNLLQMGARLHQAGLKEEFREIIDTIVSIAKAFFEKEKDGFGFEPARILHRAAYLCLLSRDSEIEKYLVSGMEKFWPDYIKKYPRHRDTFFNELLGIKPEKSRFESLPDAEDAILAQFNKTDISDLVKRLRLALKIA